ncbi:MAG TPA: redoxin domain-containing protein [Prolixibacteraceae bacterium]|nr:redoxin domain-containing protein [Prolixibacteraceae bacterium]HPS12792.1 redoxin domain-containing protein [Prolixibacteraceae bacterium]
MKKIILFLSLGIAICVTQAQIIQKEIPADYGYLVNLGQTVPDFDIVLLDGTQTNMQALRGNVVMLQFTASWCSVCRKEMPHIEKEIWQKHKNNPRFALYGIDLKEVKETIAQFQKQTKITYPLALDPDGKIFFTFAAQDAGVTRNVIVDKSGKIVYMTRLYKEEEFDEMKKVIEGLLSDGK